MHEVIRDRLDEYLKGGCEPGGWPEYRKHLEACRQCRQEVGNMQAQAWMLRTLRSSADIEPRPGFHGRVLERIETLKDASLLFAFLDLRFLRGLAMASVVAVLAMAAFLFYGGEGPGLDPSTPLAVMASETPTVEAVGGGASQDREKVLLALASYED
jgi:hypothetical protein